MKKYNQIYIPLDASSVLHRNTEISQNILNHIYLGCWLPAVNWLFYIQNGDLREKV